MADYIENIGCDDDGLDLFEGLFAVPEGIAYNSYIIKDEKIAVMDAVDKRKSAEWMDKLSAALGGRKPDYLIVQHVEPDHSSSIAEFLAAYPETVVVGNSKTFTMLSQFYGGAAHKLEVKDGDELSLGSGSLKFIFAPMVHWPEVMVTYEASTGSLFSADAFGKFGSLGKAAGQPWEDDARRYYYNIIGKLGLQVRALLSKAAVLDIRAVYPLHGPVLDKNLPHYFGLYNKWSNWAAEEDGIVIACGGAHGNTLAACGRLAAKLEAAGQKVKLYDISRTDISYVIADAFKYDRLVVAATTYYSEIYPVMETFISRLLSKGYHGRKAGIIENGTWLAQSGKKMLGMLQSAKDMTLLQPVVSIKSALSPESEAQLDALAAALII